MKGPTAKPGQGLAWLTHRSAMDGTNHSRGSTLQSLSPDKREDLEHELRPEALASIAREEDAEASTNTTHAAVSPKPRAETASSERRDRSASGGSDWDLAGLDE